MKNKRKNANSTDLGEVGIRWGDSQNMLPSTHECRKEENLILTPEILKRVAGIARVIIERIRSSTQRFGRNSHTNRGNNDR